MMHKDMNLEQSTSNANLMPIKNVDNNVINNTPAIIN